MTEEKYDSLTPLCRMYLNRLFSFYECKTKPITGISDKIFCTSIENKFGSNDKERIETAKSMADTYLKECAWRSEILVPGYKFYDIREYLDKQ